MSPPGSGTAWIPFPTSGQRNPTRTNLDQLEPIGQVASKLISNNPVVINRMLTVMAEMPQLAANAPPKRTYLRRWVPMDTSSAARPSALTTPRPAGKPAWKMSWWAPDSVDRESEGR